MILPDTHAWIWLISNPELLSDKTSKVIHNAIKNKPLAVSSISAWELALLVAKKRLELTMTVEEWITKSEKLTFLNFIPVDNRIAVASVNLPQPLHNDPADRIIIATAMSLNAILITKDDKILEYPYVKAVW